MKLVAFCEAQADFRLASGLVDLVLRESGLSWVVDNLPSPETIRTWMPDGSGRDYFDIHKINEYVDKLKLRVASVRGHFTGRPGGAGSSMARKAFLVVRALQKKFPDEAVDAVVLIWDTDQQRNERPEGVAVAAEQARPWGLFQIACGFPDPQREAWVLAGFDPCNDAERARLADLRRELGFSPVHKAGRLRDPDASALRNIKRVLGVVTGGDADREARCWTEISIATLRERGGDTGLAEFLDQLAAALLPLLDPNSGPSLARRP